MGIVVFLCVATMEVRTLVHVCKLFTAIGIVSGWIGCVTNYTADGMLSPDQNKEVSCPLRLYANVYLFTSLKRNSPYVLKRGRCARRCMSAHCLNLVLSPALLYFFDTR